MKKFLMKFLRKFQEFMTRWRDRHAAELLSELKVIRDQVEVIRQENLVKWEIATKCARESVGSNDPTRDERLMARSDEIRENERLLVRLTADADAILKELKRLGAIV